MANLPTTSLEIRSTIHEAGTLVLPETDLQHGRDDAAVVGDARVTSSVVVVRRRRDGGVLVRPGQTEGSVDLAVLAGQRAAAVICESSGTSA